MRIGNSELSIGQIKGNMHRAFTFTLFIVHGPVGTRTRYARHSSGKYLFYSLEYLLLYRLVLNLNRVGELGQQVLLFSGEFRGNDDVHSDIQIASSRSTALGDTAPFDTES